MTERRKLMLGAAILNCAFLGLAGSLPEAGERSRPTEYLQGVEAMRAGNYPEAEAHLRAALVRNPESARATANLARTLLAQGRASDALAVTEKALETWPDHAFLHFVHARALCSAGRADDALPVVERSLALDPRNGYAWNLAGYARLLTGEDREAVHALERAAVLLPEVPYVWRNLGVAHERSGNHARSRECWEESLRLEPGSAAARAGVERAERQIVRTGAQEVGAAPGIASR